MGKVVDLEGRKVRALAAELLPVLPDHGSIVVNASKVDDVDRWRRAARLAGRELGCRIPTGVAFDGSKAWAASLDHELTEADRRRAGLAMDALFDIRQRPRQKRR
jgi:hypothetical protein